MTSETVHPGDMCADTGTFNIVVFSGESHCSCMFSNEPCRDRLLAPAWFMSDCRTYVLRHNIIMRP